MKKLLAFGLLLVGCSVTLIGCGEKNNSATDETVTSSPSPTATDEVKDDENMIETEAPDDENDNPVEDAVGGVQEGVNDAVDGVQDGVNDVVDGAKNATKDVTE